MDLVWSVGEPKGPRVGPSPGQKEVAADATTAVRLDSPVEHAQGHVRRHDLDHGNLGAGRLVANRVHEVSGFESQEARLLDLDARRGNICADNPLLGQRFAEGNTLLHAPAHGFQGALCQADQTHAVMDAAWPKPALSDLETPALAQQYVRRRH